MAGGSELEKAIRKLAGREKGWEKFLPPPAVGGRPGGVGVGRPAASGAAQTGGGAGFVEKDAALREYWPAVTLLSSDGIFSIEIEPIKRLILEGEAVADFKQPPAP